jgi:dCTP diphosphatase
MDQNTLATRLRKFAQDRDWEQFHSPKNLVMALSNEVGELTELFQWLTEKQSTEMMNNPDSALKVKDELADVFIYLVRLADILNVDLFQAACEKMDINQYRFPVEKVKGKA